MKGLRNYGVYRLPDGESYLAVRGGSGAFYLFDRSTGILVPPLFEVRPDGLIARWFNSGPEWRVEQLTDTGESLESGPLVPYQSRRVARLAAAVWLGDLLMEGAWAAGASL